MTQENLNTFAVLPLRDIVVFPGMIVPLFVGREKSVNALEEVVKEDKKILLIAQKNASQDDPGEKDLYQVGTVASILQLLRLPDGTVKVLIEGVERAKVVQFLGNDPYFKVEAQVVADEDEEPTDTKALSRSLLSEFEQYVKLNKKIPPEILSTVEQIESPSKLADTIASHLGVKLLEKQQILEILSVPIRLEQVFAHMEAEIGVLNTEKRIRSRVKRQMEKTQREYYLNEQMKAIQRELTEGEEGADEVGELEKRMKGVRLSKEAREKALAEIKKLRQMSPMSAEATVIRNYLDWMLSLPWKKPTRLVHDVKGAKEILDKDHYGLEKVKERILEYLAVQQRTKQLKGPILCLVGPPGVGKTSLARSIAKATGRNYVRMSLGGVRDESEIRGHRRTYIGSMPGKILQSMKKSKSSNPLFLLDEIDKMGNDHRGDPAAAMLEVLDPEQNMHFNDHYLEVDYDLSDVMFIATSNSYNMPRPLLDRMEIIRLSGYTEDEKVEIAKRHLIVKQMENHGLKASEWSISDDAIRGLIRYYTREAGVRSLERELANLCRKAIKEILMGDVKEIHVTAENLGDYAGVRKYSFGLAEEDDKIGVTTGLAYTEVGGELLIIESVAVPGKGNILQTGKLGDVMKESVQAAQSYVRSRANSLGIKRRTYQGRDIHVHVPEGATPKDGPSAGIAMTTTIVSVLTGIPVKKTVAMTGEVTLRGRVLAIGGLKEKLLAALRGGIQTVLIPQENVKDLAEIPQNVKDGLEIIPVSTVDEVLANALVRPIEPIPEEVIDDTPPQINKEDGESDYLRH